MRLYTWKRVGGDVNDFPPSTALSSALDLERTFLGRARRRSGVSIKPQALASTLDFCAVRAATAMALRICLLVRT